MSYMKQNEEHKQTLSVQHSSSLMINISKLMYLQYVFTFI